GRVPAAGRTALLIIDMMNTLDFGGGEAMLPAAQAAADRIAALREKADGVGVPVVYVNDNYDQWHSERSRLIELARDSLGRPLVERLAPRDDDYFVIKPQFSGFYSTNLPVLLPHLGASRLILTGVAADICVLFTAADAHMREYGLWVPEDCTASSDPQRTAWSLEIMRGSMKAETRSTDELPLSEWLERE
ncbi:MAG TPA: isochorismatase family cysteine hydrolase, partial [Sphingomonas sp.]